MRIGNVYHAKTFFSVSFVDVSKAVAVTRPLRRTVPLVAYFFGSRMIGIGVVHHVNTARFASYARELLTIVRPPKERRIRASIVGDPNAPTVWFKYEANIQPVWASVSDFSAIWRKTNAIGEGSCITS